MKLNYKAFALTLSDDAHEAFALKDEVNENTYTVVKIVKGLYKGQIGIFHKKKTKNMCEVFLIPEGEEERKQDLGNYVRYQVVDTGGCAFSETEATDSKIVFWMEEGTVVSVLESIGSDASKRVLVNHVSEETGQHLKGWASIQTPQGCDILKPLTTSVRYSSI